MSQRQADNKSTHTDNHWLMSVLTLTLWLTNHWHAALQIGGMTVTIGQVQTEIGRTTIGPAQIRGKFSLESTGNECRERTGCKCQCFDEHIQLYSSREASFRSARALWDYVPLMARGNPTSVMIEQQVSPTAGVLLQGFPDTV
eukprot:193638-Rhodomonas_salina.1